MNCDNEQIKADLRKIWNEVVDIIQDFGIELTGVLLEIETNEDGIEEIGDAVKRVATLATQMETATENYETKIEEAKSVGIELKDCLTENGFRIDSEIMLCGAGIIGTNIRKITYLQKGKSKTPKVEKHITELVGEISKNSKSIERFIDLTIKGDKAEKIKKSLDWKQEDIDKPLTQKEINALLIGDDSLIEQVKGIKTVEQALKAVEYGCMLDFVPEELRTAEVCLKAVRNIQCPDTGIIGTSNALQFVPEALKTAKLCAEAVKNNYRALAFVPEEFKTEEFCLKALEQDGSAFKYVPEKLKTEEFCRKAVKLDGCALEFVPEELKTAQLCLEAVRSKKNVIHLSPPIHNVFEFVPEVLKTAELCAEAVKNDGWAIKYVPKNLITAELYTEAVKQNSVILEYVPEEFKTFELCVEAVKNAIFVWLTLEHVPEKIKTTELWLEAVKDYIEDKKNDWVLIPGGENE
ncbi:MAG: DUF4116 domain-containing protein [Fibromonadaceae bacterium]|jgi:endonuclease V-like protein UPF0215 family/uncharacterized metal-binding protein|nr:DUF4116 domain-containing protein [Fibromonadaceae bacterium]